MRMAERHDLAATIQPHRQEAGAVEQFELFVADEILQRRQTHRFPDGQPIERGGRRGWQRTEPGSDELGQTRCRHQRAVESPDPVLIDEMTGVDRAEHELPHEQDVPAAGRPDVGHGGHLDRASQHQVQQRVDSSPIEVLEVDAPDAGAMPQRVEARRQRRLAANRGHQEHQVGIHELADKGGRRGVEQGKIVDEQDQRAILRLGQQHRAHLRHHRHEVAPLVTDARRQQVGQRAERDRS